MPFLTIRLSKSFEKNIGKWEVYKSTSAAETLHYIQKLNKIREKVKSIAIAGKFHSKRVQYGNSKNLQYFKISGHTVFFSIKGSELHLMYFVASKRVKKSM